VPQSGPPAKKQNGRKFLIAGLAAALVLVIALLVVLVAKPFGSGTNQFTASNVLPASFEYPGDWKKAGEATNIAFSPHADEALKLFGAPGVSTDWSGIDAALKKDPDAVAGVFTELVTQAFPNDANERQDTMNSLLPATASVSPGTDTTVGNRTAIRYDGTLSEPSGGSGALKVRCFVATATSETDTVLFVFFGSESAWDKYQSKFEALIKSVTFSTN
jgi:hypothetical protein